MIDARKLKQQLVKLLKWKAYGSDKVHEFWIKELRISMRK